MIGSIELRPQVDKSQRAFWLSRDHHNNGYVTVYAHLSAIYVNCGNAASQGMQIGSAGSTGNSTGAHLHFEIRYMGGFINPLTVLPFG